jgi:hypothetical protein
MATSASTRSLQEVVQKIVVAQGNTFIKELLREKGLPIGTKKADFESNLLAAVEAGKLTAQDVDAWVQRVEGWGDQHIYLFNVPPEIGDDKIWSSEAAIRARLRQAGLDALLNAEDPPSFPTEPTLTGITYGEGSLRFIWHKSVDKWDRTPAEMQMDERREIGDEVYEFRAYRFRPERTVTRFELRLPERREERAAAIFVPVAIASDEHQETVAKVEQKIASILDFEALRRNRVKISQVIKNLDQARVAHQQGATSTLHTQSIRLTGGGGYVEFGSESQTGDFLTAGPVREVRLAIGRPDLIAFTGSSASFEFEENPGTLSRQARVQLYGEAKRVRIWRQLTADDVWAILRILRQFENVGA